MIDRLPLWDLVEWRARSTPGAVMAVDESGRSLTFGAYRDRCERVAAGFAALRIGRDDAVAWILPTGIEALVVAGALARLGAVQVPVLPILREAEVSSVFDRARAVRLVVPGTWRGFDYPSLARTVAGDAVTVVDRALPEGDPGALPRWSDVGPGDGDPVRWIFFTSGTTARPKGCLHTDRTVGAAAHRLNVRFRMSPADCNALVFPVTHVGGISFLMGGLMAGYRHVLVEAFDASTSPAVLGRAGVTVAGAGPAFWAAYVAAQRADPTRRLFPALRALVGGGAAKPPTLQQEVREVLGVPLVTGYGLSECPGVAHNGVDDPPEFLPSDGHALDDSELKIVGPDGRRLAPGEAGEIACRGPMLFRGYLDAADDAFDDDGWFLTGDIGVLDDRGLLRVTGRSKDIIIRKGENLSAKEIEDALHVHPAIADVAAVALPDGERGELCCAVVVLADGCAAPTLADLARHCRSLGLATQKVPERLEVVDELPRSVTGKVEKRALVARFSA